MSGMGEMRLDAVSPICVTALAERLKSREFKEGRTLWQTDQSKQRGQQQFGRADVNCLYQPARLPLSVSLSLWPCA